MTDPTMENKTPQYFVQPVAPLSDLIQAMIRCAGRTDDPEARLLVKHLGWHEQELKATQDALRAAEQAQKEAEEEVARLRDQVGHFMDEELKERTRADQATREVRDKTIEECARVCEHQAGLAVAEHNMALRTPIGKQGAIAMGHGAQNCAAAIRALSDKQPEEKP